MTVEFTSEQTKLVEEAIQSGIIRSVDDVVDEGIDAVRRRLAVRRASEARRDPDEWMRKFRAWAYSHPTTPLLSDEAISRESIYGNRGL